MNVERGCRILRGEIRVDFEEQSDVVLEGKSGVFLLCLINFCI